MCLISFAWQVSATYPFALIANRDEFHARPTQHMHKWPTDGIVAGRDLQAGGTWLGMNREGRFAALTNFREPASQNKNATLSRGKLVTDILKHTGSLGDVKKLIETLQDRMAGFNLLYGDVLGDHQQLHFASNRGNSKPDIEPGIYAFSNGAFDEDWPKTERIHAGLTRALRHRRPDEFWIPLEDRTQAQIQELPETGIGLEWELFLSSIFIVGSEYGTRSSHRILCPNRQEALMHERRFDTDGTMTGVTNIRIRKQA